MKNKNQLDEFFRLLGLTREEQQLFTILTDRGALTILELARRSGISRTQVYRIAQNLIDKGLICEVVDEHRTLTQAAPIGQLEFLVKNRQTETEKLIKYWPLIENELRGTIGLGQAETKVQFYRGKSGIRQMIWHTLRTDKEVLGFTYRTVQDLIGYDFMADWRDAFIKKGLVLKDIFSEHYLESKNQTRMEVDFPKENFISRFLAREKLNINIQSDYYNDVTALYSWHEGDIFGVEIYNAKLSQFNKQIFQILWDISTDI